MSNDAYGNLGNEMRAMKDGRASLMAGVRDNRKRIRTETGQTLAAAARFVAETGKANEKRAAQTHQMMAQAKRNLKAQGRQTLAEANELAAAIRKDVAALKADAGRILAGANGFLAQTGADNAKLRTQTRRMLAHARNESKAEAGKVMAQAKEALAGLRMETGRVLADATAVIKRLSEASRHRAAGWRNILGMLHGNASRLSASTTARYASSVQPARKTATKRTRPSGKRQRRRVA